MNQNGRDNNLQILLFYLFCKSALVLQHSLQASAPGLQIVFYQYWAPSPPRFEFQFCWHSNEVPSLAYMALLALRKQKRVPNHWCED
jgi:hypothetical protein